MAQERSQVKRSHKSKADQEKVSREAMVQAGFICYVCKVNAPAPGLDEFHGHSCIPCRVSLAEARRNIANDKDYIRRPEGN